LFASKRENENAYKSQTRPSVAEHHRHFASA
jgi:hypothetical protein